MLKLNETPVRTSRNFNINNIKLENISIPEKIEEFQTIEVIGDTSKIIIDSERDKINLAYGLGEFFTNQVNEKSNKNIKINIDKKLKEDLEISFKFDENNINLIDNIEIIAEEKSKATVILKYLAGKNIESYHNGIVKVLAKKNAEINIVIVNFMNKQSNNFISIENEIEESANIKYTIIDFGGKVNVTNYYSNLIGDLSKNTINTIYLGNENQLFDLNYIGELRGKKSDIEIEVQGALKDNSKKHFKGTIDFKKGCKKAKGNENENCILLSDTAKSLALPMLLCSEEDVEGNHSSSAGKIGEKELFYIMSRGFNRKEAMKLMVRAKFNKILKSVKNEELKNDIFNIFDEKLS